MNADQYEQLRLFFDDYAQSFFGDDRFINANLQLKLDHTHRVGDEMRYLADRLKLSVPNKMIALATALLHDIARFPQFARYRTYNDCRSINHSQLGVDELLRLKVLDTLSDPERRYILTAVQHHGAVDLPADLSGETLLHCRLIRDADKIDIYHVILTGYAEYLKDPHHFPLELDFPDEPGYSPELLEPLSRGQPLLYGRLKTLNDLKLMQLGWVFNINFTATLDRIRQRGYLRQLADYLPPAAEIKRFCRLVFDYVDRRIAEGKNC